MLKLKSFVRHSPEAQIDHQLQKTNVSDEFLKIKVKRQMLL